MNESFAYYKMFKNGELFVPLADLMDETGDSIELFTLVDNPSPINVYLSNPLPSNFGPVDLITTPALFVSEKIANVLRPLNITDFQMIPVNLLRDDNKQPYKGTTTNYWGLHICNRIKCVDLEKSDLKVSIGIRRLKRLVLDEKVLGEIPLENRLIFKLKEDGGYDLFHKSVVEKIMAVNPTNITFVPVEKLGAGTAFQL